MAVPTAPVRIRFDLNQETRAIRGVRTEAIESQRALSRLRAEARLVARERGSLASRMRRAQGRVRRTIEIARAGAGTADMLLLAAAAGEPAMVAAAAAPLVSRWGTALRGTAGIAANVAAGLGLAGALLPLVTEMLPRALDSLLGTGAARKLRALLAGAGRDFETIVGREAMRLAGRRGVSEPEIAIAAAGRVRELLTTALSDPKTMLGELFDSYFLAAAERHGLRPYLRRLDPQIMQMLGREALRLAMDDPALARDVLDRAAWQAELTPGPRTLASERMRLEREAARGRRAD